MPAQAQSQASSQPTACRLSDQELVIQQDVYDALPLFYRSFVDLLVQRGEWKIQEAV